MSYTAVVLNGELFEQLIEHASADLQQEARDNAERIISGLCFTEEDVRRYCEEDERWATLSPGAQAAFVDSLLDCGEYKHATMTANEAVAEAVVGIWTKLAN